MFVFGSSVVDNGNNNNLTTLAKANFLPYGIDFVTGPTGRSSNGKNVADFIGDFLQLPLIPAFANPQTKGDAIIHGVNYGSGGSGILDETGLVLGDVFTLNEQIRNFKEVTLPELKSQLNLRGKKILLDYLFLIAAGNNDYLLNYFLLGQITRSPQDYAAKLISTYFGQLKSLYDVGARNFLLLSVYPVGCSPVISKGQGCLSRQNEIVTIFYDQLISMVNQFKFQMRGSNIIVLNSVKAITSLLNNPGSTGISNVSDPCCELSSNGVSCKANGTVCNNRNKYVFFDGQHNTQAFSAVLASTIYTSNDPTEVYPYNLQQLIYTHI